MHVSLFYAHVRRLYFLLSSSIFINPCIHPPVEPSAARNLIAVPYVIIKSQRYGQAYKGYRAGRPYYFPSLEMEPERKPIDSMRILLRGVGLCSEEVSP